MKKLFVTMTIVLVASLASNAQGYRRAGTNAQIRAMERDEIKRELHLTNIQAMDVDAIQQNYMLKIRSVKMDSQTSDAEKEEQVQVLKAERNTALKKVLTADQIAKMDAYYNAPKQTIVLPQAVAKDDAKQ